MKALVLKEFGRLAVEELPDPTPAADEVLLRIVATGICGSDIHGFTGENGRRVPGQVMGHESVATIAGFGRGIETSELREGQVVTFNPVVVPEEDLETYAGREQHSPNKYVIGVRHDVVASFAELMTVPLRNVVPLPDNMPVAYGALVEPLAVAVHAVRRAGVGPGQAVFVAGGGPIGQSVVLALLMVGIDRIAVSETDPGRRALVRRLGAVAIDPTAGPVHDMVCREFGGLADAALDAVGISPTVQDALLSTKLGGVVCLVGMGAPRLELDAFRVSTEERSLIGSFTYSADDFRDAADWMARSPSVAAELISREVPLDEANEAFAALARADGTPGKVLVRFASEVGPGADSGHGDAEEEQ